MRLFLKVDIVKSGPFCRMYMSFCLFDFQHRDVHKVCNWDEKGPQKVHKALKDEVTNFIKQVQEVR